MSSTTLRYALVTPARNEAENLRRLGACLRRQTCPPALWVVVDDGSTDETRAVVEVLAQQETRIRLIDSPGVTAQAGALGDGRRQGRDVLAFNAGIAVVREELGAPDIVLKLDADVSLGEDFFARLLAEFDADPKLGIAGGSCFEREDGEWVRRHVTGSHVRGATRAYRWTCFEDVSPLEEQLGWDGIDEIKAVLHGWTTRSVYNLPFFHHRPLGAREGARRSWESRGSTAHFMGYRPSYLLLRSLFQARRDPRALAMIWGYVRAVAAGAPQCADDRVRAYVRGQQSLSRLPMRLREALGRVDATAA
ncbi:MAG: glycosyltransferase family 2 protein [Chloroflexota bacterium]|nr:glycosyltransferase family 2 protein [Chloroflexota bacterium]